MRAAVLVEPGRIEMEHRPIPSAGKPEMCWSRCLRWVSAGPIRTTTGTAEWAASSSTRRWSSATKQPGTIVAVGDRSSPLHASASGCRSNPSTPTRTAPRLAAADYNLCPHMRFFATPPVDGALCDYVTIGAAFAHPVPDTISDDAAALCEPLSVGIAAVRKAGVDRWLARAHRRRGTDRHRRRAGRPRVRGNRDHRVAISTNLAGSALAISGRRRSSIPLSTMSPNWVWTRSSMPQGLQPPSREESGGTPRRYSSCWSARARRQCRCPPS